ncbi:MAG: hypothetical protein ABII24_00515 [bacterium]
MGDQVRFSGFQDYSFTVNPDAIILQAHISFSGQGAGTAWACSFSYKGNRVKSVLFKTCSDPVEFHGFEVERLWDLDDACDFAFSLKGTGPMRLLYLCGFEGKIKKLLAMPSITEFARCKYWSQVWGAIAGQGRIQYVYIDGLPGTRQHSMTFFLN